VAVAPPPKPIKPVARDLSVYARQLRLPTAALPLTKFEVSQDIRAIAALPLLSEVRRCSVVRRGMTV